MSGISLAEIESALKEKFSADSLLFGEAAQLYADDESHARAPKALAVFFPEHHDDVVDIVRFAKKHACALVPSGGRTGLSGAACAHAYEVVVSLERMSSVVEFDELGGVVTVEAGMTIEAVQKLAEEHAWFYPVDYASKSAAQIGGAVATNAGGIRVLRYGMTRSWVLGLKAVTGNGDTLCIDRCLVKDNAGYDLKQLLIGSEGTLAIITEVSLGLTRPMPDQLTILCGFSSAQEMVVFFTQLQQQLDLSAAEFYCDSALSHACGITGLKKPMQKAYRFYLMFESDKASVSDDVLYALLGEVEAVVSQNIQQTKNLWRIRENISSSLNPLNPYKNDISCRLFCLADWVEALEHGFSSLADQLDVVWFGHLGDGNAHINIVRPESMSEDEFAGLTADFDQMVFSVTRQFNASASAEHGIGLLKKGLLASCRSTEEIALYAQIKSVFDPENILNPGKLL